jgi:hypothetical protein
MKSKYMTVSSVDLSSFLLVKNSSIDSLPDDCLGFARPSSDIYEKSSLKLDFCLNNLFFDKKIWVLSDSWVKLNAEISKSDVLVFSKSDTLILTWPPSEFDYCSAILSMLGQTWSNELTDIFLNVPSFYILCRVWICSWIDISFHTIYLFDHHALFYVNRYI